MSISIIDNFNLGNNLPLDSRTVVGSECLFKKKEDIVHKYKGLIIWDNDLSKSWIWKGLTWSEYKNSSNFPIGTIIQYSGFSYSIPEGWQLCDGTIYDIGETQSDYRVYSPPHLKSQFYYYQDYHFLYLIYCGSPIYSTESGQNFIYYKVNDIYKSISECGTYSIADDVYCTQSNISLGYIFDNSIKIYSDTNGNLYNQSYFSENNNINYYWDGNNWGSTSSCIYEISFPVWSDNNVDSDLYMDALNNYIDYQGSFNNSNINNIISINGDNSYKWSGGVLATNGKIYGIPYNSNNMLIIDTSNNTYSLYGSLSGVDKWSSGVLAPNGRIYGIPSSSNSILKFYPQDQSFSNIDISQYSGNLKWSGGVLAPNGKIYCIPHNSNSILLIDTEYNDITKDIAIEEIYSEVFRKWSGGVLAPNNCIYAIPFNANQVLKINTTDDSITLIGNLRGTSKWSGGVLGANGKIYGIPYNSGSVLEIDTNTDTVSTFGNLNGQTITDKKWSGGVLAPNGKIYGIPNNSNLIIEITTDTYGISLINTNKTNIEKWKGGVLANNGFIYTIPYYENSILYFGSTASNIDENMTLSRYLNKF